VELAKYPVSLVPVDFQVKVGGVSQDYVIVKAGRLAIKVHFVVREEFPPDRLSPNLANLVARLVIVGNQETASTFPVKNQTDTLSLCPWAFPQHSGEDVRV
jgi:hypothetical protein